ncbi:hypothetical protein H5410_060023 [Solanum commersonii]|uniref:Uncharacterized protein n=1 Tax=Solanum commersonii TaxID=4109 RepID=A0A9J5W4C0_SOLCO|nr:hypothetical protein H5410_060023 [Solanum commersonii]
MEKRARQDDKHLPLTILHEPRLLGEEEDHMGSGSELTQFQPQSQAIQSHATSPSISSIKQGTHKHQRYQVTIINLSPEPFPIGTISLAGNDLSIITLIGNDLDLITLVKNDLDLITLIGKDLGIIALTGKDLDIINHHMYHHGNFDAAVTWQSHVTPRGAAGISDLRTSSSNGEAFGDRSKGKRSGTVSWSTRGRLSGRLWLSLVRLSMFRHLFIDLLEYGGVRVLSMLNFYSSALDLISESVGLWRHVS